MDVAFNEPVQTRVDSRTPELRAALDRVAELETELRQLRAEQTVMTSMRLRDVEASLVKQAMDRAKGNVSRAARSLGLSRAALYRRLERHALART
jgi:transcriptional regulator of acetoin/glycerol metabolism